MNFWRCIKCCYTHKGTHNQTAFRCTCGQWCVDVTEITNKMKSKGDLKANEIKMYQGMLEQRCLG